MYVLIVYRYTVTYVPCFCVLSDEIDIIGYGSGTSDTDDHSSVESGSSDGYTISAKRIRSTISSYSQSL